MDKLQELKALAEKAARELRSPGRGTELPCLKELASFIESMDPNTDFGGTKTPTDEYLTSIARAMEENTRYLGDDVSSWLPNIGEVAGILCDSRLSTSNRKTLERALLLFCDALDIIPAVA